MDCNFFSNLIGWQTVENKISESGRSSFNLESNSHFCNLLVRLNEAVCSFARNSGLMKLFNNLWKLCKF